ncbi:hypothetical protein V8E36_007934 [Tilletia maclaganii]
MYTSHLLGNGALALAALTITTLLSPTPTSALEVTITLLMCSFCVYSAILTAGELSEGSFIQFTFRPIAESAKVATTESLLLFCSVTFSSAGIASAGSAISVNVTWSSPFRIGGRASAEFEVINAAGDSLVDPATKAPPAPTSPLTPTSASAC